jgi:hypothetical protein
MKPKLIEVEESNYTTRRETLGTGGFMYFFSLSNSS